MQFGKNLIFIVAYNHENFIQKVISRIPKEVLTNPLNEVLIIDDASFDKTFYVSDQIRQALKGQARITVLKNPVNQGYGGNQKLGYRYAIDNGFDRVILVHGDGQYAPELVTNIISEYYSDAKPDAVFGTRMASWKSPLKGGMPIYKFIGNKVLTKVQNFLLGSKMSEFHSGYRSYSTALLKQIPFEVNSNDFHFDTEIIIQCLAAKSKIVEIPIPTHYGEEVCHVNGMNYAMNVITASIHYMVQQMGFLYDRKYDVKRSFRDWNPSPYSPEIRIASTVAPMTRVLVVGFDNGQLVKLLTEKGCIVDLVDYMGEKTRDSAIRNVFELDLIRNPESISSVFQSNEYEFILLPRVLEQLPHPEKLLDTIRYKHPVRPRPQVIASSGNVAFFIVRGMLMLGQFNYGVGGILDKSHFRLFTKKSYRTIFEQACYTIKKEGGVPMPLTRIFSERSWWGKRLEAVNMFFAKIFPNFFSYQFLISAEPLPTTHQILEICAEHSTELRQNQPSLINMSEYKS